MAFEHPGDGALNYMPCRYGESKILFRGPGKSLDDPFAVFFGGTETYGRFVAQPYPELVGNTLGHTAVNMGCVNAGIDVYSQDRTLLNTAAQARVTVIQVMGAHNMSNRFYSVHPRRNDRFIGPSTLLKTVYREVDFTDFAFTRHLLQTLAAHCPTRFALVVDELKAAWVARMRLLLDKIEGRKVLLWMADHAPEDAGEASDPLFVDRAMLDKLRPLVDESVEVVYSAEARNAGTAGMVFCELEAPAALEAPSARAHEEVAAALAPKLRALMA